MDFIEVTLPDAIVSMVLAGEADKAKAFKCGKLVAIITRDKIGDGHRWHLSLSHRKRIPTWDEVSKAVRALLPIDIHYCIPFPTENCWINLHPYTLHAVEVRDEQLVQSWEFEGKLAKALGVGVPS